MTVPELNSRTLSIKHAVASATTCSSATVDQLTFLLRDSQTAIHQLEAAASSKCLPKNPQRPYRPRKAQTLRFKEKPNVTVVEIHDDCAEFLEAAQRCRLATEIVNTTLKSLTEAIRSPKSQDTHRKSSIQRTSSQIPSSPRHLQPRCANQIMQTPEKKTCLQSAFTEKRGYLSGVVALAECARAAFAALRRLDAQKSSGTRVPSLQIETGMSALIGKMITLGLDDMAIKELRILVKRLSVRENATDKSCRSAISSGSKSLPSCQTLSDLLVFESESAFGERLNLIVTSQLLVLRLLVSKKRPSSSVAAYEHLQTSTSYSPANLLSRLATESSPGAREKAAKQLEVFAQFILSLCPSILSIDDEMAVDSRRSLSPSIAFKYQVLALEIRVKWWRLSSHKADLNEELVAPFTRFLKAFSRRSSLTPLEKYHEAKEAYQVFSTTLDRTKNINSESHVNPSKNGYLDLYQALAILARDACIPDDTTYWTRQSIAIGKTHGVSQSRICEMHCQITITQLKGFLDGNLDDNTWKYLKTATEALQGDLQGDSADLDSLLVTVARLRKLTFHAIFTHSDALQSSSISGDPGNVFSCIEYIDASFTFLGRYVGTEPSSGSNEKITSRYYQRRMLAQKMVKPGLESLSVISKHPISDDDNVWTRVDQILQFSAALLPKLNCFREEITSIQNSNEQTNSILLSHAYWFHYLRLRQNSLYSVQLLKCLRNSVKLLDQCSLTEKITGLLPSKLERLGALYETDNKSSKSLQVYAKSLKLQIEAGVLLNAATHAASRPLNQVLEQNAQITGFHRSLTSFFRVVNEADDVQSNSSYLFDDESLPRDQRGLILEQQLLILERLLQKRFCVKNPQQIVSKIINTLLELYTNEEHPIRRLRTIVCLLHLYSNHPSALPEHIFSQISGEFTFSPSDLPHADIGLERFKSHLLATRDAHIAIATTLSDISSLQITVSVWIDILSQCKTFEALHDRIHDVPAWLNQLTSVADFLDMQGDEVQRVKVLDLIANVQELDVSSNPATTVSSLSSLGRQLLRLGDIQKAGLSFQRANHYMSNTNISAHILIEWHLSSSEYFQEIGNMKKCADHLSSAITLYSEMTKDKISMSKSLSERRRVIWTKSRLVHVQSLLSSTQGQIEQAMLNARESVKLTYRAWAILEHQCKRESRLNEEDSSISEVEAMSETFMMISITDLKAPPVMSTKHESLKSTPFWHLSSELFRRLSYLSGLFAHGGSISEAQYYVEQASKIATAVNSKSFRAQLLTLTGKYDLRRGEVEEGLRQMEQVKTLITGETPTPLNVVVELLLAEAHGSRAQWDAEELAFKKVEESLQGLGSMNNNGFPAMKENSDRSLALQLRELSIKEVVSNQIQASKKGIPTGKRPVKKVTMHAVPDAKIKPNESEKSVLLKYYGRLLRHRAVSALHQNKSELAASYLTQAAQFPTTTEDLVSQNLLHARTHLCQSLQTISNDPVFCILHESTVSFPSIALNSRRKSKESLEPIKENEGRVVQSRKAPVKKAPKNAPRKDSIPRDEINECLGQALDMLIKAHSSAPAVASSTVIHALSDVFGKVLMMLHAACFDDPSINVNPFIAVYAIELGRSLSTQRESLMIQVERAQSSRRDSNATLLTSCVEDSPSTSICSTTLWKTFQSDYIDIIPSTWTAISLSLSANLNELQFSKLRAGQTPFILSIPLNRHNSRDPDEQIFAFSRGKSELVEIVDLANYSTHDTIDMSRKGAKTAWWEVRSALDSRLKDLLENIENIWLGGFRGIFSQEQPCRNLLSRFQKSFYNILDKHLPSRQKNNKAAKATRVTLDQRVLELFIGLGNPCEIEDLDEPLMDLLYFVVDILQFHGERNAYDEIDFDSITVETLDVLRHYHEAAIHNAPDRSSSHTILILDKALHGFPWESLPCMANQAISRLPSLVCLRDRILQIRQQQHSCASDSSSESLHIDSQNTAYILNPSADLSSTQSTFSPILSSLSTTPSVTPNIIARDPTEAEFSSILSTRSLFLYFGHGSGGQYIRARTIKKLDQCAVALLMGCSSGKLKEEGKYEPHGMVYNYLHAGSPAVVGTLWDVTDKDIDRWGKECLTRWGLFEDAGRQTADDSSREGYGRGKSKSKTRGKSRARERIDVDANDKETECRKSGGNKGQVTLDQAVAWAREKCFLKYLNGAAPVVYGIPVCLSDGVD